MSLHVCTNALDIPSIYRFATHNRIVREALFWILEEEEAKNKTGVGGQDKNNISWSLNTYFIEQSWRTGAIPTHEHNPGWLGETSAKWSSLIYNWYWWSGSVSTNLGTGDQTCKRGLTNFESSYQISYVPRLSFDRGCAHQICVGQADRTLVLSLEVYCITSLTI